MFSVTSSLLKSPNRILTWYLVKWSKACSHYSQKLSFESSHLTSVCARPFRKIISSLQPVSTTYFSLSPTNSTPLTTVTTLWCTKKSVPNLWLPFSLGHWKSVILCAFSVYLVHLTFANPLNLIYTPPILWPLSYGKWPWLIQTPHITRAEFHVPFPLCISYHGISPIPLFCKMLLNIVHF
jgi:hypothetical protein